MNNDAEDMKGSDRYLFVGDIVGRPRKIAKLSTCIGIQIRK
jgi:hypothetical protein